MRDFSERQWFKLLSSIEILNSGIETESLAARLIASVSHLVSSEIAAFEAFRNSGEYHGIIVYEPADSISQADLAIYTQLVHEHPLYETVMVQRKLDSNPIVDIESEPGFENTALFNEYYRQVGVERQIALAFPVNDEAFATCALNRNKTSFLPDELLLLEMFRPHLSAAIRNSWLFERIRDQEANLKKVLNNAEYGVITMTSDGQFEFLSHRAIEILGRHFSDEKLSANSLPVRLWNWTRSAMAQSATVGETGIVEPLKTANDFEELTVNYCFDPGTGLTTLLLKTKSLLTSETLIGLGVTNAEARVLYWVAQGKTNNEIGDLCNISPRTVQKHVQNICDKLGVENRTAAAIRANETIH
jgi:DNA-binding CsgD family transcriptional regulator